MTSYEDTLQTLFQLKASNTDNHVDNVRLICEALGNPQNSYKIVHITGTNGKGTVSKQIASVLINSGYKTGLVTSPHILDFRERISVNFSLITREYIQEKYYQIINLFIERGLSYSFEQVVCILGFLYLHDNQVEYAVIEVGCGGTRDSSNIVDPLISVITSVGLDHTHMLGNTVEEIATEKSGVFKPGKPCVIGPNTPQQLLLKLATDKGAIPYLVDKSETEENFIEENTRITRKVFEIISVPEDALEKGITSLQPFRYQKVNIGNITAILDVGHNPMALNRVFNDVKREYTKNLRIVIAVSLGKDLDEFLRVAFQHSSEIHAISCQHPRIFPYTALVESAKKQAFILKDSGEISEILLSILSQVQENEILIFIGSCFAIEYIIQSINHHLELHLPD